MKILHTADWHLGRHFEGRSLEADHQAVLDQVLAALIEHTPDALLIAGDVFDRAAPPETAVRQLNDFIQRVTAETEAAIVMIAGNHDSGDRIGAMATLANRQRAHVRGPLIADKRPFVLTDAHGPVAFSALPFGYEHAARACFVNSNIRTPADVMRAQVAATRPYLPAAARWVVVAHGFIDGGTDSDSERSLSRAVGGIETVPADVFEGAHYVALGHLHRPQIIGSDRIRYSGSPLAFGFDEEGDEKSMALVDIDSTGAVVTQLIPFAPLRHMRTVRGLLDALLEEARKCPSDDFVRIVLTDPERRIDAMKRMRELYPNACNLAYERETPLELKSLAGRRLSELLPAAVVAQFIELTIGRPLSERETAIVAAELTEVPDRMAAE